MIEYDLVSNGDLATEEIKKLSDLGFEFKSDILPARQDVLLIIHAGYQCSLRVNEIIHIYQSGLRVKTRFLVEAMKTNIEPVE